MKCTAIAAAWIVGATVPLLASVVLVFGCCVLPFHAYIHKAIPLCHVAVGMMTGEQHGAPQQQVPASKKQQPVPRITSEVPNAFQLSMVTAASPISATSITAYRSFIALGALRCDRDVGLNVLIATFLI